MGKLRDRLEGMPDEPASREATDTSYGDRIECAAKHFLAVLDSKAPGWEPQSDKTLDIAAELHAEVCAIMPRALFQGLSEMQAAAAVHLAYRAFVGD